MIHDRDLTPRPEESAAIAGSSLEQEELALRRRLLFHLLQDFDFDQPRFRYEAISSPVPGSAAHAPAGRFFTC